MTEMTSTSTIAERAERALKMAREGRTQELENAWVELAENPPQDAAFYTEIIKALVRIKARDLGKTLMVLLLGEAAKRKEYKFVHKIMNVIAPVWPHADELKAISAESLRALYGGHSYSADLLAAIGVDEEGPLDQLYKKLAALIKFSPGRVYTHATWGEGVITNLDIPERKITLDFPKDKGKVITFEGASRFLNYVPPTSFLARRAREADKLKTMADDDPAGLVRLVLESSGGRIKQSELKALLINGVVDPASWNSWWTRTRNELRIYAFIDFDPKGGAHAELNMRSSPKTFEQEVADLFFSDKGDMAQRVDAVERLFKEQRAVKPAPELLKRMLARVEEEYQIASPASKPLQLEFAFLADDIQHMGLSPAEGSKRIPTVERIIAEFWDYEDLNEIENVDYAVRALKLLLARDGEKMVARALELLPNAHVKLAQAIWREMDDEKHADLAALQLQKIIDNPLLNPDTYYWAVKGIIDGTWEHLEDYFPVGRIIVELIENINEWHDLAENPTKTEKRMGASAKSLVTKFRAMLQANHFAPLCRAVEELSLDQAVRLRKAVQMSPAFNDPFKAAAERQLSVTRQDFEKAPAPHAEESDFHYVTARAKSEKVRELQNLNAVEIPENSREIEEARQEGDLRENAGYHAAKDKQKMLMQKSLQLQQAVAACRVFAAANVKEDSIGFGVRFVARNMKTNEDETYIVLGRWEADAERRIFSYQAPMMQQFMDKKAGDELEIKHPGGGQTLYRVVSLGNALAGGDWEEPGEEARS